MSKQHLTTVLQALALLSTACRTDSANQTDQRLTDQNGSGASAVDAGAGPQPPPNDPTRTLLSAADCHSRDPSGALCESGGEHCSGTQSDCVGEGPMLRCSGGQWECQCAPENEQSNTLRWNCRVQMHAAGPLPPPELSELADA